MKSHKKPKHYKTNTEYIGNSNNLFQNYNIVNSDSSESRQYFPTQTVLNKEYNYTNNRSNQQQDESGNLFIFNKSAQTKRDYHNTDHVLSRVNSNYSSEKSSSQILNFINNQETNNNNTINNENNTHKVIKSPIQRNNIIGNNNTIDSNNQIIILINHHNSNNYNNLNHLNQNNNISNQTSNNQDTLNFNSNPNTPNTVIQDNFENYKFPSFNINSKNMIENRFDKESFNHSNNNIKKESSQSSKSVKNINPTINNNEITNIHIQEAESKYNEKDKNKPLITNYSNNNNNTEENLLKYKDNNSNSNSNFKKDSNNIQNSSNTNIHLKSFPLETIPDKKSISTDFSEEQKAFMRYNILTYSPKIQNNIFHTYFEDEKLEEKFKLEMIITPKNSVTILSLVILLFYATHMYFSVKNYFNLTYTICLSVVLILHIFLSISIHFVKNLYLIVNIKRLMFILLMFIGCYNFLLLNGISNIAVKEVYLIKNIYVILILTYISYCILLQNSKLKLFSIWIIHMLILIIIQCNRKEFYSIFFVNDKSLQNSLNTLKEALHSVKDNSTEKFSYHLNLSMYRNNTLSLEYYSIRNEFISLPIKLTSIELYQEIIACICCILIYMLNAEFNMLKRLWFLNKENIHVLYKYYQTMVDSLTHQVVCFFDEDVVFTNNSFKQELNLVTDEDCSKFEKLELKEKEKQKCFWDKFKIDDKIVNKQNSKVNSNINNNDNSQQNNNSCKDGSNLSLLKKKTLINSITNKQIIEGNNDIRKINNMEGSTKIIKRIDTKDEINNNNRDIILREEDKLTKELYTSNNNQYKEKENVIELKSLTDSQTLPIKRETSQSIINKVKSKVNNECSFTFANNLGKKPKNKETANTINQIINNDNNINGINNINNNTEKVTSLPVLIDPDKNDYSNNCLSCINRINSSNNNFNFYDNKDFSTKVIKNCQKTISRDTLKTKAYFSNMKLETDPSVNLLNLVQDLKAKINSSNKLEKGNKSHNCLRSFTSLGIFKTINSKYELAQKILSEVNKNIYSNEDYEPEYSEEDISLMKKTPPHFFYECSIRSFYVANKGYLFDIVLNDISTIKIAEKEAIETKLKHSLFSKIAHEFKTPLTSIITIIDDLEYQIENNELEEMKKSANNIQNLSHYTVFLINDIIQYASNDAGKIKIHLETVNLRQICKFCFDIQKCLLGSYSTKKKVKSIIEFDDNIDSYEVISDEIRLKQILLNLISNSVKFTKCGSIKISAKLVDKENSFNRTHTSTKSVINRFGSFSANKGNNNNAGSILINSIKESRRNSIVPQNYNILSNAINNIQPTKARGKSLFNKDTLSSNNVNNNCNNINKSNTKTSIYNTSNNIDNKSDLTSNTNIGDGAKLIKITVTDTGIGMKPQDLEKLKNKEELIKINTENDYNKLGSGLGLNIVNTICSLLDIKFEVNSEYGKGTEFVFYIKPSNSNSSKIMLKQSVSNKEIVTSLIPGANLINQGNAYNKSSCVINNKKINKKFRNLLLSTENEELHNMNNNNLYTNFNSLRNTDNIEILDIHHKSMRSIDLNIKHIPTIIHNDVNEALRELDKLKSHVYNTSKNVPKVSYSLNLKSYNNSVYFDSYFKDTERDIFTSHIKNYSKSSVNDKTFILQDQDLRAIRDFNKNINYLNPIDNRSKSSFNLKSNKDNNLKLEYINKENLSHSHYISNDEEEVSNMTKDLFNFIMHSKNNSHSISRRSSQRLSLANKNRNHQPQNSQNSNLDSYSSLNTQSIKNVNKENRNNFLTPDYIYSYKNKKSADENKKSGYYNAIKEKNTTFLKEFSNIDLLVDVYRKSKIEPTNTNYENSKVNDDRKIEYNYDSSKEKNNIFLSSKHYDSYLKRNSFNVVNKNSSQNLATNFNLLRSEFNSLEALKHLESNSLQKKKNVIYEIYNKGINNEETDNINNKGLYTYFNTDSSFNSRNVFNMNPKLSNLDLAITKAQNSDMKISVNTPDFNNTNNHTICSNLTLKNISINNKNMIELNKYTKSVSKTKDEVNTEALICDQCKCNFHKNYNQISELKALNDVDIKNVNSVLKCTTIKDSINSNLISNNSNSITNSDPLKKNKIIIADDNSTVRKSLINILRSFKDKISNYDLIEVDDGIDIIKEIVADQNDNNKIKAVFTDENMEYINGSEAIKILRELQKHNKIKNCLYFSITAFEDNESKERILRAGADLVLSKPASKRQVQEVFEKFFYNIEIDEKL